MMMLHHRLYSTLVAFAVVFSIIGARPARLHAQVAEAAATGVVLNQIRSELNSVLASATQAADYVMAGAAVKMLDGINLWEQANTNLLDKAFRELDVATRNAFSEAELFSRNAKEMIAESLTRVEGITNQINHVAETTILSGRRSYLVRQNPVVIKPNAADTVLVRFTGVNLDVANPHLVLQGDTVRRSQLGPMDVIFHLPLSAIPRDSTKLVIHRLTIGHRTRDGKKAFLVQKWADVERQMIVATLPRFVGSYTLTGVRGFEERVATTWTNVGARMTGRDENKLAWARPLDGWQWDIAQPFRLVGAGGQSARCQHMVMSNASGNGVQYQMRFDHRTAGTIPRPADGNIKCNVTGTIVQMQPRTASVPEQSGVISWTSDLIVPMPDDTRTFELTVKTFDGREVIITNTGSDKFFDVRKEPGRLIIKPRIPTDFIG